MRTAQLILACVTLFAGSMKADPEQQQIVDTVTGLMTALANEDTTKFQSVTGPGFYIFDGGARFDGDKILGLIKTLHAAGKRFEWKVTDPDIHIEGDTAWIAYVNKGSITDASGTSPQNWLESGFLKKRDGKWEILFMHSTRVPKQ
jgi:ketosteroid isomerase-like protein